MSLPCKTDIHNWDGSKCKRDLREIPLFEEYQYE